MPQSRERAAWRLGRILVACCLAWCCWGRVNATELRRTAIVKAIEQARPAVVNIHGEKTLRQAEGRSGDNEGLRRVNGMGTGIVLDERGYIITNHHVVDGVQRINVTLHDRSAHVARIVSFDPATDLAIIKIDVKRELPTIRIGTSSDLMTGEPVIAVGNAYGYEHTVTRGIISALHRTVQVTDAQSYDDLIQTDASINPGNSGGPLLNIDGELIGINVAVRAGAQGIGFAIPADKAMAVAADLLSTRRVNSTWHGIVPGNKPSESLGLVVESLSKDSPASKSELRPGDVIAAVGKLPVARALDLERALLGRQPGDTVELQVQREDQQVVVEMVLADLPQNSKPAADPTWEFLGLKLEPIPAKLFQQYETRYRGGLSVKAVRTGGPAAQQGIRTGDVLVGMHIWETISLENISYILSRPDLSDIGPLKFYILRGSETLYGHMQVSMRVARP
jgi:serine protease Do